MRFEALSRVAVVLIALALLSGCGSSSSSSPAGGAGGPTSSSTPASKVHFAKTKFVLHAGLAFGAFHRYLYRPLRAGAFARPLSHKATLVKAALAAAFVVHELRIAFTDAQSSRILRRLVSPITVLRQKVTTMVTGLRAGHYDPAQINSAQGDVASVASKAAGAGAPVKDLPAPAF